MILFYAVLSSTYATLFIHGCLSAHRHTQAIERGLGRRLKRTTPIDWSAALYLLIAPVCAVSILLGNLDWLVEAAAEEIDKCEGGCTQEEWDRVLVEIDKFKGSLV
jgi:hypothetical protein